MVAPQRIRKESYFHPVDYLVFVLILLISVATGAYFAIKKKLKRRSSHDLTVDDYLTGVGKLKPIPVAASLIASYISGLTMLGNPAEIYFYGSTYVLTIISMALCGVIISIVYIPVFFNLHLASSYEYLELRFGKTLRTAASVFFIIDEILFVPVLMYIPSLAFNEVSGLNIYLVGTIVTIVCIFYTVMGGLRAVVWTDTWQIISMYLAVIILLIVSFVYVGSPSYVFSQAAKHGRLNVNNWAFRLTDRYSIWGILIGQLCYWVSFNSVNQTMVQRYVAVPTLKKSRLAVALFITGCCIFVFMCFYTGNAMFVHFKDCDPILAGQINQKDKMVPLFVMELLHRYPGLPGIYMAGVFGAALSSLSVVLNSLAIVIKEDLVKGVCGCKPSAKLEWLLAKGVALLFGLYAVLTLYVVQYLGLAFALVTSLTSIVAGTMFGVFTMGMLFPWANSKGALTGAIAGFLFATLVSFGTLYSIAMGLSSDPELSRSVEKCDLIYGVNVTLTQHATPVGHTQSIPAIFRVSYLWVACISSGTCIVVGVITSFIFGKNDISKMDPLLISPICQWMLPATAEEYRGTAMSSRSRMNINNNPELDILAAVDQEKIKSTKM